MKSLLILNVILVPTFALAFLPLSYSPNSSGNQPEVKFVASAPKNPKTIEAYQDLFHKGMRRDMELPTFEKQSDAIGYIPQITFAVPPELKQRVNFWKKIYSEYTSKQAVIHDADHPEIVYSIVDVSSFSEGRYQSYRAMNRAMQNYLNGEKEKIARNLKTLDNLEDTPEKIPQVLYPLLRKFDKIREPNKFRAAADRIRSQIGQRERIVQGFLFGGRYFSKMMQIFSEKGIPQELTRLPLVESAFNLSARSKVGASGIWQFMRSTGEKFLRIDRYIDERNDPITATYAAAELLKQNYESLKSWPLAITAYNHGREGMLRASRRLASSSLPYIIQNYKASSFGFASSNFYSEFLAILEVEKEYRQHFGALKVDAPMEFSELTLSNVVRIPEFASECGISREDFAIFNPGLATSVLKGSVQAPRGLRIRVPPENRSQCMNSRQVVGKHFRYPEPGFRYALNQKRNARVSRIRN